MNIDEILKEVVDGKPISKDVAIELLSLEENSLEVSLLRSTANMISRERFNNKALMLGQIGIDMGPCAGDCAFCFFAQSHTSIEPSVMSVEDILSRTLRFVEGGAQGVFLITMHRFGFQWFYDLCIEIKKHVPEGFEILSNVGDIGMDKLTALKEAGISGAYHVCRLREGRDSCMEPNARRSTIERIIDAGLSWYNMCEPIGPEHTPRELADQIWVGLEYECTQHGAMQRFPVPGSPLYDHGQITQNRLGQVVAVIVLATIGQKTLKSIAVNVSNIPGLFSGANAFFPETGEPDEEDIKRMEKENGKGFSTALWRQSNEISTFDCRNMMKSAGFSSLMTTNGNPAQML